MEDNMTEKRKLIDSDIDDLLRISKVGSMTIGDKTTVVDITLPNGFVIVVSASCVDAADYDIEKGRRLALQRAKDKIWELEGYLLQQQIYEKEGRTNGKQ
jgi:hypothetical protein